MIVNHIVCVAFGFCWCWFNLKNVKGNKWLMTWSFCFTCRFDRNSAKANGFLFLQSFTIRALILLCSCVCALVFFTTIYIFIHSFRSFQFVKSRIAKRKKKKCECSKNCYIFNFTWFVVSSIMDSCGNKWNTNDLPQQVFAHMHCVWVWVPFAVRYLLIECNKCSWIPRKQETHTHTQKHAPI